MRRLRLFSLIVCAVVLLGLMQTAYASEGVTDFASFQSAIRNGTVTLEDDLALTADASVTFVQGTLDLNGHRLTVDGTSGPKDLDFLSVRGKFVLRDSAGGGSLVYNGGGSAVSVTRKGTADLQSGRIASGGTKAYLVKSNGLVYLRGCEIDGADTAGGIHGTNGHIYVWDGDIHDCAMKGKGAAIRTEEGCALAIRGGVFHDNEVFNRGNVWDIPKFGRGGAVSAAGLANITGGSFTSNRATYGGAVHFEGDALIERAVFDSNEADGVGGAVFCDLGSRVVLEAPDGEAGAVRITNNKSFDTQGYGGGGIYVEHSYLEHENAQLYLSYAVVTQNTVEDVDTPHPRIGGGVATCGVSNTTTHLENGCAFFDNHVENSEVPEAQDIWCQSDATFEGIVTAGVPVQYTGRKRLATTQTGEPFEDYLEKTEPVDALLGESVTGGWLLLTTNPDSITEADKKLITDSAGVIISGNSTQSKGGGVAGNGIIQFGGEMPVIELIREPRDAEGSSEAAIRLSTTASAAEDHTEKNIEWSENARIYDTVSYSNLREGQEYELHTTVYESKSRKSVVPDDDEIVTRFAPDSPEGEITVEIPCDTRRHSAKDITVVQELWAHGMPVAYHLDLTDADQTLHVLSQPVDITTNAKIMGERNGQNVEFIGNRSCDTLPVEETVSVNGLEKGLRYTLVCSLLDAVNGEAVFTREYDVTAEDSAAEISLDNLYLPLQELTGTKAVVGIELYRGKGTDGDLVASHMDTLDTDETVEILRGEAEMQTQASVTQGSGAKALSEWSVTDTVGIDDEGKWIEGGYLRTQIADADTGDILFETERQVNDFYGGFANLESTIADDTKGTVLDDSLTVLHEDADTLPAQSLGGRNLVIYEQLLYYGDEVQHTDPEDTKQQFVFDGPQMATRARSLGSSQCDAGTAVPIDDAITITNWYETDGVLPEGSVLRGFVVNKDTRQILKQNEKNVSGSQISEGRISLTNSFSANLTGLDNTDIVIMEQLWIGEDLAVSHEDLTDQEQTILVDPTPPSVRTTAAADAEDGTVTNARPHTITDTVHMEHLKTGREYTLKTTLADKETGREYESTEKTLTFTATDRTMDVETEIAYDGLVPAGGSVVVFERLYSNDELEAEHADIEDEAQTVPVRMVPVTTLAFGDDDAKELPIHNKTRITDRLTSEAGAFAPDRYYRVRSWLVDKESGQAVTVGGESFTSETTVYVPMNGTLEADAAFTVNSMEFAGREMVVFEEVYTEDGVLAAEHKDLNDADQTLRFVRSPVISTKADDGSGSKILGTGIVTVVDHVDYSSLTPGAEYRLEGSLVNRTDGSIVAGTALMFTPEEENGTVDMELRFTSENMGGTPLVVYEELYDADDNLVADHVDSSDRDQQMRVGAQLVSTAAGEDGTKFVPAQPNTTICDSASFSGLEPGVPHTVIAQLADAETGSVLSEQTVPMTPSAAEGTFETTFTLDTSDYDQKRLVVLYEMYQNSELVIQHNALDNIDQSVLCGGGIMTDARAEDGSRTIFRNIGPGQSVHFTDTVYWSGMNTAQQPSVFMKVRLYDKKTGEVLHNYTVENGTDSLRPGDDNPDDGVMFSFNCPRSGSKTVEISLPYEALTASADIVVGIDLVTLDWDKEQAHFNGFADLHHNDLNDTAETIHIEVPQIVTSASEVTAA